MKKIFTLCALMASMLSTNLYATYYVVGNGTDDPNGNWVHGENWNVSAAVNALDANGTITFTNVAGGKNYGFKITDGAWNTNEDKTHEITTIDYDNCAAPMYGGNGNDVGFTLSEDADVTVSLVEGKIRLTATKPLAYRSNYYYIAGNYSNWGSWGTPKGAVLTNDQISATLPVGKYEFKITNGNWGSNNEWGYSKINISTSSPMFKDDSGNIVFRLLKEADVVIKIVKNKVVLLIDREFIVTGNGNNGLWLNDKSWAPKDDDATLNANYSRTFTNLQIGTYEFKVKENVDGYGDAAWHADCTWGFDHLDGESSNAGENNDGNIAFTLDKASNVTIALVNNKIVLTVVATDPTAIDNVTLKNNGKYYDILGREVANPQKGNLYIHNGKKVLF